MYSKNQKNYNNSIIYLTIILNVCSYLLFYFMQDFGQNIQKYLFVLLPAFTGYFIIIFYSLKYKESNNLIFIILFVTALIVRFLLMPSDPVLSDDVYRYLWDGKVFIFAINPYEFAPQSQFLEYLRDGTIFPYINFPDIPTVYPPMSQIIFAMAYLFGYNVLVWKLILLLFEGLLVFYLIKLIDHFSLNKMRIFIYVLNPLVIIETYHSGHLDVIGVAFVFIGIYYFYKNKTWASLATFILAVLIKYKPIFFILPFLKKRFIYKSSILIGVVVASLVPFIKSGVLPTAGIVSYTNRWEFNGFIYKLFIFISDHIGITTQKWFSFAYNGRIEDFYLNPAMYYRMLLFFVILFIVIDQFKKLKMTQNFKGVNYLQSSFFICASILLLSPTLYPWYLVWLIPFLIFLPNWSWLFFTFLIQISYFVLEGYKTNGIWQESSIVLLVQYVPFYVLLIFEYLDRRKIKGWFI